MLPADLPDATFDLIVVGDLLYYLSAPKTSAPCSTGWCSAWSRAATSWSCTSGTGRPAAATTVIRCTSALAGRPGLERLVHHEDEWFLLDVLRRA